MDRSGKLTGFDPAIDRCFGVFNAPVFKVRPAEELNWPLSHSIVLVCERRTIASRTRTNGSNAEADHMQEIGFLAPYLIAFNVSCKRRFEALALAVMPSA